MPLSHVIIIGLLEFPFLNSVTDFLHSPCWHRHGLGNRVNGISIDSPMFYQAKNFGTTIWIRPKVEPLERFVSMKLFPVGFVLSSLILFYYNTIWIWQKICVTHIWKYFMLCSTNTNWRQLEDCIPIVYVVDKTWMNATAFFYFPVCVFGLFHASRFMLGFQSRMNVTIRAFSVVTFPMNMAFASCAVRIYYSQKKSLTREEKPVQFLNQVTCLYL